MNESCRGPFVRFVELLAHEAEVLGRHLGDGIESRLRRAGHQHERLHDDRMKLRCQDILHTDRVAVLIAHRYLLRTTGDAMLADVVMHPHPCRVAMKLPMLLASRRCEMHQLAGRWEEVE